MTENTRSGREPIQVVQIDQDFCNNTYGSAPCTASLEVGGRRCFNTRSTCQDPDNYDKGTLTLYFCDAQARLPEDGNFYFPFIKQVKVTPGRINPGGGRSSAKALGQRAVVDVTFSDHPDTDLITDPYVADRDYNPLERSSFWAKWRARNPYYTGRQLRYISGYLNENRELVDTITRTFFIEDMAGPDRNGRVRVVAKDVLSKVQNDKAKAPAASTGTLLADIDAVTTTVGLTPSGVGDEEYPASGYVRIGGEVMSFTRSGDTLTVVRAEYNTDAAEHDAGDVVQLCLEYSAQSPPDILYDLFTTYAGIPASLLDKTGWDAEAAEFLPRLYSTLITEPTGVSTLINEMCDQMYFYIWWDERADLVRMRSVRPATDEEVSELSNDRHIIKQSVDVRDLSNERLTQVWVYHALRDPTKDLDEAQNYGALEIRGNDGGGTNKFGEEKIKTIYSRWITGSNGAAAIDLGDRLLARYGNVPREVTFALDAKDRDIWVGDFVQVEAPGQVVDDEGNMVPINLQLLRAQEASLGTTFTYVGQEFVAEEPPEPGQLLVVLTGDQWNVNLRTAYDETIGVTPVSGDTIRFVIRSNSIVGGRIADQLYRDGYTSQVHNGATFVGETLVMPILRQTSTASQWNTVVQSVNAGSLINVAQEGLFDPVIQTPQHTDLRVYGDPVALRTGSWPAGVNLELTIEPGAKIVGAGGYGSIHTAPGNFIDFGGGPIYLDQPVVHWPSDGGSAIAVEHPITINNLGEIKGGGAGGVGWSFFSPVGGVHLIPGGGGAGSGPCATTTYTQIGGRPTTVEIEAAAGSLSSPGVGGQVFIDNTGVDNRITCSTGGAIAADANRDITATIGGDSSGRDGVHQYGFYLYFGPTYINNGIAGAAVIKGKSSITWVNKGNVQGLEYN